MTLVSFRLFRKNLGNLQEFFGQMVHRPPGKKLPVRLCTNGLTNLTIKYSGACLLYTLNIPMAKCFPLRTFSVSSPSLLRKRISLRAFDSTNVYLYPKRLSN